MAQYDVYLIQPRDRHLLDVQSDLIVGLSTRLVVPLLPAANAPQRIRHLNPLLQIDGQDYVMATSLMASAPKDRLDKIKANLLDRHDDISRAIYMIFQGF